MSHPENANLTISTEGLALIKKWEGWYPKAYKDPVGIWTIGWGTTGEEAVPGRRITKKQGETFLRKSLQDDEATVKRLTDVPLTQHQFDALVSFVYNVGSGNYSKSTLRKLLNRKNYAGAAQQFVRFNKARSRETGKWMTLRGLTNRREDEAELFRTPDDAQEKKRTAEVARQAPMTEPQNNESSVSPDGVSYNENALQQLITKSDTFKMAILSITGLGATVSQSLQPFIDDPVKGISLAVAILSTSALIYIKWRDLREGR